MTHVHFSLQIIKGNPSLPKIIFLRDIFIILGFELFVLPNYANGFLSIRVMIVSSITLGTFLMHRIRNVLTLGCSKVPGDHGTWLPIRPAVTYVYTLPCFQLPSTVPSLLHN